MDSPKISVLSCASVRNQADGNHLAQHAELSLVAIGLAVYIQSLPTGTRIGIKDLAGRFPESEHRIARALRELEVHGYLERTRVRLPGGQVVTRTVSYNRPGRLPVDDEPPPARPPAPPPTATTAPPNPMSQTSPAPPMPPTPPRAGRAPLPRPVNPDNHWRRAAAITVLGDLRRLDSRLVLGQQDIDRLAPAVEAWLERGVSPGAVGAALTANLPSPPRNPAGLVAHRLTEQLPPALPATPRAPAYVPPHPFQTCEAESCGLAFRSPAPGLCGGCREAAA
ncbi:MULTISPECIES: helix-turn-helix domain-containing protein [unclassified Streptomyces]|uniref:helix-turn-helix domain-containing protein n=1 Tax=unclassified Streptomyces TaxID=2593676 RepID=UPI001BEC44CE|nr:MULTISPECIES: helix-turn-helix domain-containing protein [unclassified Streptomyces]MBT2402487.1 helix-turn-helix domain-containing protein [Streptomyces sp. ISL-21]MBT2610285.1 helix-turn-helix domain-containing protein [Streptomyces sp. ISL-87]